MILVSLNCGIKKPTATTTTWTSSMQTSISQQDLWKIIVISALLALFIAFLPGLEDFLEGFLDAIADR